MANGGALGAVVPLLLCSLYLSLSAFRVRHAPTYHGRNFSKEDVSFDFMTGNLETGDEVAKGSKCHKDKTYYAASFPHWFPDIEGADVKPVIFDVFDQKIKATQTFYGQGKCVVYQLCHNNQNVAKEFASNQSTPRVVQLNGNCKMESQVREECTLTPKSGSAEERCSELSSRLRIAQDQLKEIDEWARKAVEAQKDFDAKLASFRSAKKSFNDVDIAGAFPDDTQGCPGDLTCELSVQTCCLSYVSNVNLDCSCVDRCGAASDCKDAQDAFEQAKKNLNKTNRHNDKLISSGGKEKRLRAAEEAMKAWTSERTRECDNVFPSMWSSFVDCVRERYNVSCNKECVSTRIGSGVIEGFDPDGIMGVGVKAVDSPPRSWMLSPWREGARQYRSWSANTQSWNDNIQSSEGDTAHIDLLKQSAPRRYTQRILTHGKLNFTDSNLGGLNQWWHESCFVLLSGDAIHSAMMLGFAAKECTTAGLAEASLEKSVPLWNLEGIGDIWSGDNVDTCFTISWPGWRKTWDLCVADSETPNATQWKKMIQGSIGMFPADK
eukprot:TRINITY_DN18142_c0_g1_i1.p1 TRINITY_DN18142_c0_g1~~TRINITY_DN18142_c0_g1_i1.p1  ORF type:complete len:574 (+),score=44.56 TRINITY_DN18142_c0_g1_i1:74-1723(+)